MVDAELLVVGQHDPLPDMEAPQLQHVDTVLKMPEAHAGVDMKLLRAVWHPTGYGAAAHALWFASAKPTVNCAEMGALVWGMELLAGR